MGATGFSMLLLGVSGVIVAAGALYVFTKLAVVLTKLERKLDREDK